MIFKSIPKEAIKVSPCKFTANDVILLLHKDGRADMNILDETVGAECWQKEYYLCRDTLMCRVGVKINGEWVWKSDAGDIDANNAFDPKKSEATDAFKRACMNWGIGRELYTAPKIVIPLEKLHLSTGRGEPYVLSRLFVSKLTVEDGKILALEISQDYNGIVDVVYDWSCTMSATKPVATTTSTASTKASTKAEELKKAETKAEKTTGTAAPVSTKTTKTGFVAPTTTATATPKATEPTSEIEMSLDDAFAFVYPFGKNKGKTMRQLTIEDPNTIRWVANEYNGRNHEVKAAAQIILETLT